MHVSSARLPIVHIHLRCRTRSCRVDSRSVLLATRSKRQENRPRSGHKVDQSHGNLGFSVPHVSFPTSDSMTQCRKYSDEECGLEERGSGTVNRWTSRSTSTHADNLLG